MSDRTILAPQNANALNGIFNGSGTSSVSSPQFLLTPPTANGSIYMSISGQNMNVSTPNNGGISFSTPDGSSGSITCTDAAELTTNSTFKVPTVSLTGNTAGYITSISTDLANSVNINVPLDGGITFNATNTTVPPASIFLQNTAGVSSLKCTTNFSPQSINVNTTTGINAFILQNITTGFTVIPAGSGVTLPGVICTTEDVFFSNLAGATSNSTYVFAGGVSTSTGGPLILSSIYAVAPSNGVAGYCNVETLWINVSSADITPTAIQILLLSYN